jgi:nucleotide-binding universal stress UspA family protein
MQRTLLVPLDGKPLAESALPLAGLLARVLDANLDLVVVVPPDYGLTVDEAWARGISADAIDPGATGAVSVNV